jgi:hypothetical protein
MGAVLSVVGGPELFRRPVIPFVEQGIESFQYDRLIFSAFELFIVFLSCKSMLEVLGKVPEQHAQDTTSIA